MKRPPQPRGQRKREGVSPHAIAHSPLLSAKEKLDLLARMRVEVTGALENDIDPGLDPADVDEAMQSLRRDVENGEGSTADGQPYN